MLKTYMYMLHSEILSPPNFNADQISMLTFSLQLEDIYTFQSSSDSYPINKKNGARKKKTRQSQFSNKIFTEWIATENICNKFYSFKRKIK